MKRILAVIIALVMTASMTAVPVFAAGEYVNDADKAGSDFTTGVASWKIDYANEDTTALTATPITSDVSNFDAGSKRYGAVYKMKLPEAQPGKTIQNAEFRMSTYYSTGAREIRYIYKMPGNPDVDSMTVADIQTYIDTPSYGTGSYYIGSPVKGDAFYSDKTYRCGIDVTDYVNECISAGQEYMWIIALRDSAVKAYRHDCKGFETKLYYEYADAESFGVVSQIPDEAAEGVYPLADVKAVFNNDVVSAEVSVNGTLLPQSAVNISEKTVTVSYDFGLNKSVRLDIEATDISSQTISHTINFTTAEKYDFYDDSDMSGVPFVGGLETWQLNFNADAEDASALAATPITDKSNFVASKTLAALYKMEMPEIPEGKVLASAEFRVTSYYSTARPLKFAYKFPGDDYDMSDFAISDAQKYISSANLGGGEYYLTSCMEDASYASARNYRCRYDVTDYIEECIYNNQDCFWIAVTHSSSNYAYPHDSTTEYWRPKLFYTFKDAEELAVVGSEPADGAEGVYPKGVASVTFTNPITSATVSINGVGAEADNVKISGKTVSVNYDTGLNADTTITVNATDIGNNKIKYVFSFVTDSKYAYYNDSDMEDMPYTSGEGTWVLSYVSEDENTDDNIEKAASAPDRDYANFVAGQEKKAVVYKMKLPEVPEGKRIASAQLRATSWNDRQRFLAYSYKMPGDNWDMDNITVADAARIINADNLGKGANYLADCTSDASYYDGVATNRSKYDVTDYINECIRGGQEYVWFALTSAYAVKPYHHDYGSYFSTKLYYTFEDIPEQEVIIEYPKLVDYSDEDAYYELINTTVSVGKTIKGVSYMKNTTSADVELLLAVAQYNGNILVSVSFTPYTLKAGEAGSTVSYGEVTVDNDALSVKTFIWNQNLSNVTKHSGAYIK